VTLCTAESTVYFVRKFFISATVPNACVVPKSSFDEDDLYLYYIDLNCKERYVRILFLSNEIYAYPDQ
jgi:hypothetical protein